MRQLQVLLALCLVATPAFAVSPLPRRARSLLQATLPRGGLEFNIVFSLRICYFARDDPNTSYLALLGYDDNTHAHLHTALSC